MGERDRELETIKCPACGANTRTKVKKDTALVFFSVVLSEMQKGAKDYLGGWEDNHL